MASRRPAGTEPATARPARRLRLWLAVFGMAVCAVATLVLAELAQQRTGTGRTVLTVLAGVAFLGALLAVADVAVLTRRWFRGRHDAA